MSPINTVMIWNPPSYIYFDQIISNQLFWILLLRRNVSLLLIKEFRSTPLFEFEIFRIYQVNFLKNKSPANPRFQHLLIINLFSIFTLVSIVGPVGRVCISISLQSRDIYGEPGNLFSFVSFRFQHILKRFVPIIHNNFMYFKI